MAAKSNGTWRQYEGSLKKWCDFCKEKNWSNEEANVTHVLVFLTHLFELGLSYSVINTCRSALSSWLGEVNGVLVGQHKLVINFMRGLSRMRPPTAKYSATWNPDSVLNFINSWDNETCSLKELSLKCVALLALATGQRVQTLASIKIKDIVWGSPVQIKLTAQLKTTSIAKPNPVLILPFFDDVKICPATVLKVYIDRTKLVRNCENLFVAICKPHKAVGSQTISRWLSNVLELAGIDVNIFKAHSFRHSSTSKAAKLGVNVDTILKSVGWSSKSKIFAKFYNRPVNTSSEFAEKVLSIS